MSELNKSTYKAPDTINEKWFYTRIKEMLNNTNFGTIEVEISVQNGNAVTIKQHIRKSHSFHNDDKIC